MMEQIAVVGAGYMGGGIAQVFAMAGMDVVIVDADPDLTARHLDRLRQEAEDFENRGLFEPGAADQVRKNLRAADSLADGSRGGGSDRGGGARAARSQEARYCGPSRRRPAPAQ